MHPVASDTVAADDGVELGLVVDGPADAPPLVLVHGGLTDHRCFDPVVPGLAAARRVVRYDRRGRGLSSDADDYSLRREWHDLAEVCRHVAGREPVDVFAYSYGAMLTLAGLASGELVGVLRSVVAYEPPFDVPGLLADGVEELYEAGQVDEALRRFMAGTFHLPPPVVSAMEGHPLWEVSRQAADTLPREFAAVRDTPVPARSAFPADVPVRVIVQGEGGNPAFRQVAETVTDDIVHVSGIPHFALATDPETVVAAVLRHP